MSDKDIDKVLRSFWFYFSLLDDKNMIKIAIDIMLRSASLK